MQWDEGVRRLGFRGYDRLLGSPVQRQIDELRLVHSMPLPNQARWQRDRLASILAHARETTAFYRERIPPRLGPDDAPDVLESLPIVDRRTIKSRIDDFVSSAVPPRALWEGHTSGATGEPFAFFMDPVRRARVQAETLFFGGWAGYEVGMRHVFLRLLFWHPKPRVRRWLENQLILEPGGLGETETDDLLIRLARSRAGVVIAYPSVLGLLARRQLEAPRTTAFPFRSIVSIGEVLFPEVRAAVETAFGCPVFERYSASEVGYVAHDCERHRLHLNVGSLWIELLPLEGAPAEDERRRVVATDLFNRGMPILRYELADRVVPLQEACPCGRTSPLLRAVLGRVSDEITLPDGRMIEATGLGGIFYDLPEIRQFQIVQQAADRYEVVFVPERTFREETARTIFRRARTLLGENAHVAVRRVEKIDPLPSGKRAYILSNVKARGEDARPGPSE